MWSDFSLKNSLPAVPLSLLMVIISLSIAFVALVLDVLSGLSSAAYMTVTPFLRSLLRRMFILYYASFVCFFSFFCRCFCSMFFIGVSSVSLSGDGVLRRLLFLSVSFCLLSGCFLPPRYRFGLVRLGLVPYIIL